MPPADSEPGARADREDRASHLDEELSGLEALEAHAVSQRSMPSRIWAALWPKLAAVAVVVGFWQLVVTLRVYPNYVLPGPGTAFSQLGHDITQDHLLRAVATTMRRAAIGYSIALVLGTAGGLLIARVRVMRAAFGSFVTGLQTMPSIAWFPLALLIFKGTEWTIFFVAILGAAPAIANGLVTGVDNIPPLLLRAGRVLGARRLTAYRYVILPAALPSFIGGLKQGWAFAWRSLMAGELLRVIANQPAIGVRLQFAFDLSNAAEILAMMITILALGILVDSLFFGVIERAVRRRWGLMETTS